MSANRIAASTPSRSAAVTVTSVARSGLLHSSRKETRDRTARYSAMYRPACLISQMGVTSVHSRRHALRKGEFRRSSAIRDGVSMGAFMEVGVFSGIVGRAGEAEQARRLPDGRTVPILLLPRIFGPWLVRFYNSRACAETEFDRKSREGKDGDGPRR